MKDEKDIFATQHGMSLAFVEWFWENKKEQCGNAWFLSAAMMWEGWKGAIMCEGAMQNSDNVKRYPGEEWPVISEMK